MLCLAHRLGSAFLLCRCEQFQLPGLTDLVEPLGQLAEPKLAKQLSQRGSGRGLISVCTAGGMGVTAIVER